MRFLSIPVRNLGRRPLRSALTCLGIAVAVGSFVALVGLSRGIESAWVKGLLEKGTHILAVRKGVLEILTASMDEKIAEGLLRTEGVEEVAGELIDLVTLDGGQAVLVSGWAPRSFLWRTMHLREGRLPRPEEGRAVLVGEGLAAAARLRPGDPLRIRGEMFRVTGICRPTSALNSNTVVLHLDALQRFTHREGSVTVFNLRLKLPEDPAAVADVVSRLRRAFPDLTFSETRVAAADNRLLRMLRATAWATSLIALVMGVVVVLNTLLMSVMERTREIGVLSAVGWRPGRIMTMVAWEGLILTTVGGAAGALLGVAGLDWLAQLPRVRGFIEPEIGMSMVLEIIAGALSLGVVACLYPCWRAACLRPIEAIKYE